MGNTNKERTFLNSISILDCEKENDFDKHNREISKMLAYLNEHATAGAIVKVAHLDIAHRDTPAKYMYLEADNLYFDAINSLDWKNGIDFAADKGEFAVLVYGANYKVYGIDKSFMDTSLATYHFLDKEKIDNIDFIKNSMEFIEKMDSESFKQDFLSVIYKNKEFFTDSERIITDMKYLITSSLEDKIHIANKQKENSILKDVTMPNQPERE